MPTIAEFLKTARNFQSKVIPNYCQRIDTLSTQTQATPEYQLTAEECAEWLHALAITLADPLLFEVHYQELSQKLDRYNVDGPATLGGTGFMEDSPFSSLGLP